MMEELNYRLLSKKNHSLIAEVLNDGIISNNKGVNIPG